MNALNGIYLMNQYLPHGIYNDGKSVILMFCAMALLQASLLDEDLQQGAYLKIKSFHHLRPIYSFLGIGFVLLIANDIAANSCARKSEGHFVI